MQKLPMRNKSRGCCAKFFIGTFLYILVLLLLLFVIVFVIVPVAFKYSIGIQRSLIFPSWIISQKNYSDVDSFRIRGVKNFYVNVERDDASEENVTLGVWQILPQEFLSEFIQNQDYNFEGALTNGNYNVLLYMHGNGVDRTAALELYQILREYFLIFAVDYRGYGDSSLTDMTETGIVDDMVYFYKWLQNRTESDIYVWGHSLGTGVATHLVAKLKTENISTSGVILETPFTSVTDVMLTYPLVKVYSVLPWFRVTMIDPIIYNDMNFNSKQHILDVDAPIMILHAKDDDIIPYKFATDLYNAAVNNRSPRQGNVTYHLFEALGYLHMYIYKAPELPNYIDDFIKECEQFKQKLL